MLPFVLPQVACVILVTATLYKAGWLIVTVLTGVQPLASVTVKLYVPAATVLIPVELVELLLQLYVNGAVPPVTVAVTLPFVPP